jgi:hypothetical protein
MRVKENYACCILAPRDRTLGADVHLEACRAADAPPPRTSGRLVGSCAGRAGSGGACAVHGVCQVRALGGCARDGRGKRRPMRLLLTPRARSRSWLLCLRQLPASCARFSYGEDTRAEAGRVGAAIKVSGRHAGGCSPCRQHAQRPRHRLFSRSRRAAWLTDLHARCELLARGLGRRRARPGPRSTAFNAQHEAW